MSNNKQKAIAKVLKSDSTIARFAEVMGNTRAAQPYLASVLIEIGNSPALQQCDPQSILTAALRAATLKLNVDPAFKQAYLVPFKNKCTLIVGWKGLYDLAIATGKYRYINTHPISEGDEIYVHQLSGFHSFWKHDRDEDRNKKALDTPGWFAAFELVDGYAKTLYMTLEEIHAHKERYSQNWTNKSSAWATHTEQMERKTILRILLSTWGTFKPDDLRNLKTFEDEYENMPTDAELVVAVEQAVPEQPPQPQEDPAVEDKPKQLGLSKDDFYNIVYGDLKLDKEIVSSCVKATDAMADGDFTKALELVMEQIPPKEFENDAS